MHEIESEYHIPVLYYETLETLITDKNGMSMVKLNKNVNMCNYTVARNTYSKTKKMYEAAEDKTVIELVGIYDNNEIGKTIFAKVIEPTVMIECPELDTPTEELVKNLVKITEILKKKANHHSSMYKVYAKDQDYILHELEKLGGITDMEESEKNKLWNDRYTSCDIRNHFRSLYRIIGCLRKKKIRFETDDICFMLRYIIKKIF